MVNAFLGGRNQGHNCLSNHCPACTWARSRGKEKIVQAEREELPPGPEKPLAAGELSVVLTTPRLGAGEGERNREELSIGYCSPLLSPASQSCSAET